MLAKTYSIAITIVVHTLNTIVLGAHTIEHKVITYSSRVYNRQSRGRAG